MAKPVSYRPFVIIPVVCLLAAVFASALLNAIGGTADHVAGQIDFVHSAPDFVDGRGLNFPSAVAVDPVDGEIYVADTANNRVLGWKSASEFEGNQPADLVIGQTDFYSYDCNQTPGQLSPGSSPTENTLCNPQGVAVDRAGSVYVADTGNNRVLVYAKPFALLPGQNSDFAPELLLGQGSNSGGADFTLHACAAGETGMCSPAAVAVGSDGDLFVLDRQNNRVLQYFDPLGTPDPTLGTGDVIADRVFGQTDFNGNQPNQGVDNPATDKTLNTSSYGGPAGVAVDRNGNLYVSDNGNSRALEYNASVGAVADDPAANLIFSGFGAFSVAGLTIDSSNTLYIAAADSNNIRRIFQFEENTNPPSNSVANLTFGPSMNISASPFASLGSELGLSTSGTGNLFLADSFGNRVIEYFKPGDVAGWSPGAAGDAVPDRILGQSDFNNGGINFVDGRGLSGPAAVAIDRSANPNHIYVLDAGNSRVLGWQSLDEFVGNRPADLVVGQSNFYTSSPFSGGACNQLKGVPSAQSLCFNDVFSGGIAVDQSGNLFVADSNNNRVVEFSDPFVLFQLIGQNAGFSATTVFGQNGNFTTGACNLGSSPAPSTLCNPTGLAFDPSSNLYIADAGNSRVLEFRFGADGSFGPTPMPTAVFGQGGSYTDQTCANGAAPGPGPSPKPTPGPNNLCGSASGDPRLGVTADSSGNLYIADSYNNRVLEFTPTAPGDFGSNPTADLVFGQGNIGTGNEFNANLCSSGGDTDMCLPAGIATDPTGNLYVADLNNRRVLEYDETTQPPDNVIADRSFGTSGCASQSSAITLCNPAGVAIDSLGRLYVGDTGANRVLEYDAPLGGTPTPSATPSPIPLVHKALEFGPNPVIFPNTVFAITGATSAPVMVHLKNPDAPSLRPITLETMKLKGLDAGDFTLASTTCGLTIAAGSKCTVAITFTPSGLGTRTAHLKVFDDADNSPQVFELQGNGVAGRLQRSATQLFFGKIVRNSVSVAKSVTLTNPNPVTLNIAKVGIVTTSLAAQDQFVPTGANCVGPLGPGAQCIISVMFAPTGLGVITGEVRIHDDARNSPQVVSLQGTGIK